MDEADNFRFLIRSVREGVVEIAWARERNHHPVETGVALIRRGVPQDTPIANLAADYLIEWENLTGRSL